MKLCDFLNHTLVSFVFQIKELISVKNNCITGKFGRCLDAFLETKEKRVCKIIGEPELGQKSDNGSSYSGALVLLQRNVADILLKTEPDSFNEPWLRRTDLIHTEGIVVVHQLGKKQNQVFNNILSSLRTDVWTPFYLWFAFFFSFVVVWFLVGHYLKSTKVVEGREYRRKEASKDVRKEARKGYREKGGEDRREDDKEEDAGKESKKVRRDERMQKLRICFDQFTIIRSSDRIRSIRSYAGLAVFVLFFYWHYWFVWLFFTNSIKVNKIVVDDSALVKNFDDVMRTDRLHCFISEETELLLGQFSPPETVMGRVYNEKSDVVGDEFAVFRGKHNKCLLKMQMDNILKINEKMFFTLLERSAYFASVVFALSGKDIWVSNNHISNANEVIYYSMRNSINHDYTRKITQQYVQAGMTKKLYECLNDRSAIFAKDLVRFVNSVEQFVSESTGFSSLSFENFRTIFIVYFAFGSLLLFIGSASLVVVPLLKKTKSGVRWLFAATKGSLRCIRQLIAAFARRYLHKNRIQNRIQSTTS